MLLSQMQSEVLKVCNDMQSSDPLYSLIVPAGGAEATSLINRAANRLVRTAVGPNAENADLFPELKDVFTVGPTVSGTNTIARPAACIAIQRITSAHSNSSPTWDTTREYDVTRKTPYEVGLLTKDSTQTGWPQIYALNAKNIVLWPTPISTPTSYIDYLRVYGIRYEAALVNASDTFTMDANFHGAVCMLAAAMLAERAGWFEQSKSWYASFYDEIGRTSDVSALQTFDGCASVDNSPDRSSVYGGS